MSVETRQAVLDAAASLEYRPNRLARSLVTNCTSTLGVLLPDLYGEFFSEIIRGVDGTARRHGYHLLVSSSHANTEELVSAVHAMHGRIDGLIVMAPDPAAPEALRKMIGSFPTVLIDGGSGVQDFASITLANYRGGHLAVSHLLALGHRRIATVTGPRGNLDAQQRLLGYRAALQEGGGECDAELEIVGGFTEPSGYEAGETLLQMSRRPTAVFCANDYMALGIMGRMKEAGVQVPADLSVVGFDDISVSHYVSPALTTIHVDSQEIGARAVRRLLKILQDGVLNRPGTEILEATLVERASSGPPPKPDTTRLS